MKTIRILRMSLFFLALAMTAVEVHSALITTGAVVLARRLAKAGVTKLFKSGIEAIKKLKADHGTWVRYINNKSNRTYYVFFRSQLEEQQHLYKGALVVPDGGNVKDGHAVEIPPKTRVELDKLVMKGGDHIDMLIVDADPKPNYPIGFYIRDTGEKLDRGPCSLNVGKRIKVEMGMLTGPLVKDTRLLLCRKLCGRRSLKEVEVILTYPWHKIADEDWNTRTLVTFKSVDKHADKSKDRC